MQNVRFTSEPAAMATHVTRLLILSYIVALGIGAVNGADLSRLTEPFLAQPHANYFVGVVVLMLAFMVLVGMFRRPAALILSLVLFWASYLTMFATGELTGFWRDLALIGGLCMTAGVGDGFALMRHDSDVETTEPIEPLVAVAQRPLPERSPTQISKSHFKEDLKRAREA